MEELVAWLLLGSLWIFGGAAFFDSKSTEYKHVLAGWSLINALVLFCAALMYASFWALTVLLS